MEKVIPNLGTVVKVDGVPVGIVNGDFARDLRDNWSVSGDCSFFDKATWEKISRHLKGELFEKDEEKDEAVFARLQDSVSKLKSACETEPPMLPPMIHPPKKEEAAHSPTSAQAIGTKLEIAAGVLRAAVSYVAHVDSILKQSLKLVEEAQSLNAGPLPFERAAQAVQALLEKPHG